jgi:hypothetical protein
MRGRAQAGSTGRHAVESLVWDVLPIQGPCPSPLQSKGQPPPVPSGDLGGPVPLRRQQEATRAHEHVGMRGAGRRMAP